MRHWEEEVREIFISKKRWNALIKRVEVLEKSQRTSTSLQEIKKAMKEVGKSPFSC